MPKLVRLYILQTITGFGLSALFVAALFWFNVANLWSLVSGSDVGVVAALALWVLNGVVFAGVQFSISIMRMADDDDFSGGKRQFKPREPARVTVQASGGSAGPNRGKLF
jgi:hypothetical protein